MLTLILVLVVAASIVTFVLMKKGKIADANNNNIPDAIENKVAEVKEKVADVKAEVKEVAEKVKKITPKKKPAAKKLVKKEK